MVNSGGASVPKFGSFKPRASQSNRISNETTKDWRKRSHDDNRHHDRALEKSSRDQYEKRKGRDSHRRRSRSPEPSLQEIDEEFENFIIDLRGDYKNVEYGCLHRYSIPVYHRSGRGSVIGASSKVKIDWKQSTDKALVLTTISQATVDRRILSSKRGDVAEMDSRDLSFADFDPGEMDEDFINFKTEADGNDEKRPSEVGVGIWNFIESGNSFIE